MSRSGKLHKPSQKSKQNRNSQRKKKKAQLETKPFKGLVPILLCIFYKIEPEAEGILSKLFYKATNEEKIFKKQKTKWQPTYWEKI
jgi:hypothetical protein